MNTRVRALTTAIAFAVSGAAWTAEAGSAVAPAENADLPLEDENFPTLLGVMAKCRCQGNGKVAECEGGTCSCSYDWAGDPECTAGDGNARLLQVLVGPDGRRPQADLRR